MRGLGCNNQNQFGQVSNVWDNLSNSVSSVAENVWNDVESAGVWVGNELEQTWQDLNNPQSPYNPVGYGYQAGQQTRQAIGQGISSLGQGAADAISAGFNGLLILGGIAIIVMALEKSK